MQPAISLTTGGSLQQQPRSLLINQYQPQPQPQQQQSLSRKTNTQMMDSYSNSLLASLHYLNMQDEVSPNNLNQDGSGTHSRLQIRKHVNASVPSQHLLDAHHLPTASSIHQQPPKLIPVTIAKKKGNNFSNQPNEDDIRANTHSLSAIVGDLDSQMASRDPSNSRQFSNLHDSKFLQRKDINSLNQTVAAAGGSHWFTKKKISNEEINEASQKKNYNNENDDDEGGEEEEESEQSLQSRAAKDSLASHMKSVKKLGNNNISGSVNAQPTNGSIFGSLAVKDIGATPTQKNGGGAAASKSFFTGFMFAAKMKSVANRLVSRLQSRRYLSLRVTHLQFFNDKTIIPDEETGVFKARVEGRTSNQASDDLDEAAIVDMNEESLLKQCTIALTIAYSKFLTARMRKFIQKIPIFEPSHPLKLLWDTLNMMSITYFLLFFPLRVTFGLPIFNSLYSTAAICVLVIDVFVQLNTGFYEKGSLVNDRIGIFLNYIRRRFAAEALSFLSFSLYDFSDGSEMIFSDVRRTLETAITLLFLVRLLHLSQIKRKIEERFYQRKMLTHFLSLLSLLLNMIYIAHLLACMWVLVAEAKKAEMNTWMDFANIGLKEWNIKYLYSLYFIIVTMTTVGYGDIMPQNAFEHCFVIGIVLISSLVFSFSINNIGQIVQQMAMEKQRVTQTLQVINNYMTKKNINVSLQQQIREYLEYYLKESVMNATEIEHKIIEMLSEPLKRSLMIEANKIALKDSPIFRNNFSDTTISRTVALIEELRCTPEEVIFYEGDIDNIAIFFVQQGKVELFIDSYKSNGEVEVTSLKVFQKGSSFGETSFFTGTTRSISIRSIDFTTLLMIKREDFLKVVKESSEDYENFCKIKDNIIFYRNYEDIGTKCFSCNSRNHFVNDCPYIHFVPNKEKIIKMHQLPFTNERQAVDVCKRVPRCNTLGIANRGNEEARLIAFNNRNYIEGQDWYDGFAEGEEEQEFYNQYEDGDDDDEDEDDEFDEDEFNRGGRNTDPFIQQQTQPLLQPISGIQTTSQQQHKHLEKKVSSDNFKDETHSKSNGGGGGGGTHHHNSDTAGGGGLPLGENQSMKSHTRGGGVGTTTLEVDENRRERTSSNLQINDFMLTPSGLMMNLINPNPGNIRESSQKQNYYLRKSSGSLVNLHSNPLIYKNNVGNPLPEDLLQPQLSLAPSQYMTSSTINVVPPGASSQPLSQLPSLLYQSQQQQQSVYSRNNSFVRMGSKRKNTDRTLRSTHKRKSTKRTIDSRMNVGSNPQSSSQQHFPVNSSFQPSPSLHDRRKGGRKNTFQRRINSNNGVGGTTNNDQIHNTLLALQGMENMFLHSKNQANSYNEFDVMKSFEVYFPHNNIDVVIFQLRKKNPHLYAKQKSFMRQSTKKLLAGISMSSAPNRASKKMDLVLQKFLMSEIDQEKDKDSIRTAMRVKSGTHHTHRTPKSAFAIPAPHHDTLPSHMTASKFRRTSKVNYPHHSMIPLGIEDQIKRQARNSIGTAPLHEEEEDIQCLSPKELIGNPMEEEEYHDDGIYIVNRQVVKKQQQQQNTTQAINSGIQSPIVGQSQFSSLKFISSQLKEQDQDRSNVQLSKYRGGNGGDGEGCGADGGGGVQSPSNPSR